MKTRDFSTKHALSLLLVLVLQLYSSSAFSDGGSEGGNGGDLLELELNRAITAWQAVGFEEVLELPPNLHHNIRKVKGLRVHEVPRDFSYPSGGLPVEDVLRFRTPTARNSNQLLEPHVLFLGEIGKVYPRTVNHREIEIDLFLNRENWVEHFRTGLRQVALPPVMENAGIELGRTPAEQVLRSIVLNILLNATGYRNVIEPVTLVIYYLVHPAAQRRELFNHGLQVSNTRFVFQTMAYYIWASLLSLETEEFSTNLLRAILFNSVRIVSDPSEKECTFTRTACNFPQHSRIEVTHDFIQRLNDGLLPLRGRRSFTEFVNFHPENRAMIQLILHEYLGLMNRDDRNYSLSDSLLRRAGFRQ